MYERDFVMGVFLAVSMFAGIVIIHVLKSRLRQLQATFITLCIPFAFVFSEGVFYFFETPPVSLKDYLGAAIIVFLQVCIFRMLYRLSELIKETKLEKNPAEQ